MPTTLVSKEPLKLRICEEVTPGRNGVLKILQLSDLHFDKGHVQKGTQDYWPSLAAHLQRSHEAEPFDLVVVTGDLVDFDQWRAKPHRRALQSACLHLKQLCDNLNLAWQDRLIVIPGNHDYLYWGIWPRAGAPKAFAEVFGDFFQHRWYPRLNLLVACFDSNVDSSTLRLATGCVDHQAFDQFEAECKRQVPARDMASAYRLALVHHHVLPLAAGEQLVPRKWYERWLGRKMIGAPEMMLLRNSGRFLQYLLKHGFHLVLHGHLHSHDCNHYQSFRDQQDRLLEVIAAGATGRPLPEQPCGYNILKLHARGRVEARAYAMDEGGLLKEEPLKTATYEAVRAVRHAVRPPGEAEPASAVSCRCYTKFWDVSLPSGDLVTEHVLDGLRSDHPGGLAELPLPAAIKGKGEISEAHFQVSCADPGQKVGFVLKEIKTKPGRAGEVQVKINYVLQFDPPLGEKALTVVCRRRLFGVFLSSAEAHRFWDPDLPVDPHKLWHPVDWPCEQLLLRVRLGTGNWPPTDLRLEVQNAAHIEDTREKHAGHVMFSCNHPPPGTASEAVVAVYRPQLGYRYGLRWEVPQDDPMSDKARTNLQRSRDKLLAPNAPARQAAMDLLWEALAAAATVAGLDDPGDLKACGLLFAFNAHSGRLEPVAHVNCGTLHFGSVGWGRDIIGTAFHRHASMSFSRRRRTAQTGRLEGQLLRDLPDPVQVIYACPLVGLEPPDWPIAVCALASTDARSGLHEVVASPEATAELTTRLFSLWANSLERVMGVSP